MPCNSFRAFFAVPIAATETQQQIATLIKHFKTQYNHRLPLDLLRWSAPTNLHLTLRFLGNINHEQYEQITQQTAQLLHGRNHNHGHAHDYNYGHNHSALNIEFVALRPFPPTAANPRMLILEPLPNAAIDELAQQLDAIARAAGVIAERRKFRPHLTLARCPERESKQLKLRQSLDWKSTEEAKRLLPTPIKLAVENIILYRSILQSSGSLYVPLQEFQLKK